jgi:hypothetical protein
MGDVKKAIRTVCAWCLAVIVDVPEDGHGVSHGICPKCLREKFGIPKYEKGE